MNLNSIILYIVAFKKTLLFRYVQEVFLMTMLDEFVSLQLQALTVTCVAGLMFQI